MRCFFHDQPLNAGICKADFAQYISIPVYSIAYIEFKSEADAEKMLEEAQGLDVQGRSIIVDFVGEKSQKGAKGAGKFRTFEMSAFKIDRQGSEVEPKAISLTTLPLYPQRSGRPIKPSW